MNYCLVTQKIISPLMDAITVYFIKAEEMIAYATVSYKLVAVISLKVDVI